MARSKKLNIYSRLFKSSPFFWVVVALVLAFRWIGWDHFVIPSGSMVPNLLVFDHIVVRKHSYGLRLPFTKKWLIQNDLPQRGDVVVFRSVSGSYFMVKRTVAVPGDRVRIEGRSIWVNDKLIETKLIQKNHLFKTPITDFELGDDVDKYQFFMENHEGKEYLVLWKKRGGGSTLQQEVRVPQGHLFVLGDNRDNSQDSRYWGLLPVENLMGKGEGIWMSCEKTLFDLPLLCYPWTFRWERIFSSIE